MADTPGRYRRPLLRLRFEDDEYEGLVVRCRRPSIGEIFALRTADSIGELEQIINLFIGEYAGGDPLIIEWNLDDHHGDPVPVTDAGLRSVDIRLLVEISDQLRQAAAGVSPPLPPPSPDGDTSLEASIPMVPLSASQQSTPVPA